VPEGDTIYRSARAMQKAIAGQIVTRFETELAKLARTDDDAPVAGRIVEKVESRGKWLLVYFSSDLILATHMLMSGSWHLYRTGEHWQMPRSRMRIVLTTSEWQAVAFNVPIAEFYTEHSLERSSQIPRLGPDILSASFSLGTGVERLTEYARTSPDTEVAVALLDQRMLAGLGNVYKSEIAFAVGVHPFRKMSTLTPREIERIVDVAHHYMKANVIDGKGDGIVTYSGNRRTTHSTDREERLWVYGRQGRDCRRCGATIRMRRQGTQARSTYWCPECQPWKD
jgi:endonuclease-8